MYLWEGAYPHLQLFVHTHLIISVYKMHTQAGHIVLLLIDIFHSMLCCKNPQADLDLSPKFIPSQQMVPPEPASHSSSNLGDILDSVFILSPTFYSSTNLLTLISS